MDHSNVKKCKDCENILPLTEFYKTHLGHYMSYCKPCTSKRAVKWAKSRLQEIAKRNKIRRYELHDQNPEEYRKKIRQQSAKQRAREGVNLKPPSEERKRAYRMVHSLKKKLLITPPKECPLCKVKGRIIAHHDDYTKPLEIKWMCVRCHMFEHRGRLDNV